MRTILSRLFALALIGLALIAPAPALSQASASRYQLPAVRDDGWKTANADAVGVDSTKLANLTTAIRSWPELGVHAILIERGGQLIYEEYFDGFDEKWGTSLGKISMTPETKHDLRSVTKSVVSALVGIAHGEGAIKSLDEPLVKWFPEYPELNTPDRRRITLAHVLSMTSGFEWNEDVPYTDPRNDEIQMTRNEKPLLYALSRKFVHDPGADFNYNGGLTQVMAAVVVRATKSSLQDYARRKLFEPLGITDFEWVGDLAGMPSAASGLRLRARDLAKFGSLFLHGGKWNGKQVIPSEWVENSTRRHFRFPDGTGSNAGVQSGYGQFWWYSCYPTAVGQIESRTAAGNGQQRIFVLLGLDMVVTIFAGRYNDYGSGGTLATRILREHVLPAVKTGAHAGCPGA